MFTKVPSPDRFPHRCRSCGVGVEADRDWFDFGEEDSPPGDGPAFTTVYLCGLCLGAAAAEIGYLTPQVATDMVAQNDRLSEQLFAAQIKADGLEQGLNGLLRARFVDGPPPAELAPLLESASVGESDESGQGNGVEAGTGEPPEPSAVEGLADVHPAPGVDAIVLDL